MDNLQQLLHEAIQNSFTKERLVASILKRKFRTIGLMLTDEQRAAIDKQVQDGTWATLQIDLTDEQVASLGNADSLESIQFTDSEVEDFESETDAAIEKATKDAIETIANSMFNGWLEEAPERLAEHRANSRSFESKLRSAWKKPLASLEALIELCLQFGSDFNSEFRPEASHNNDFVFEALTRLHARACQIAGEAYVLLRSGYADGAMARWRTLHEVCVTALYISQEGQKIAERYLAHQYVSEYEQAMVYQKHCLALGYESISDEVLAELKAANDRVCNQYGDGFNRVYGWAHQDLNPKGEVKFHHIENTVDMTVLKPFVMMANSRIHAGVHALYHSLGVHPYGQEVLIAGQSMFGLSDPAQNIAYSLHLTTVTLLLSQPNQDKVAVCLALQKLRDKVFDELATAEHKITERAAKDAQVKKD